MFLLFLSPKILFAQHIICVDSINGVFVPEIAIRDYNLGNPCEEQLVIENGNLHLAKDIAVCNDSIIYGIGISSGFFDTVLFKLTPTTGSTVFYLDALTIDDKLAGMTCDEAGYLYIAGKGITKQSKVLNELDEQYLGDLPPNMQCQGDMTYRRGEFYLHSINNQLVKVNMKNPENSEIVMDFPDDIYPIVGLATVQSSCTEVITYAVSRMGNEATVYEINFDDFTLIEHCDFPFAISGSGSLTECTLPPCEIIVDLDDDNSSLGFLGNYCADTFCISPAPISDIDVTIISEAAIDSMKIDLFDNLDGNEEFLFLNNNNDLFLVGNNTQTIILYNTGTNNNSDFENALKSILYYNESDDPIYGIRKINVTAFSNGYPSIVSVADLPFFNKSLILNPTLIAPSCTDYSDGSIEIDVLNGQSPFDYEWNTNQFGNSIVGLSNGTYLVTITDALGCFRLDTFKLEEPDSLTVSITANPEFVCGETGSLFASVNGGTAPYLFEWNGLLGTDTLSNVAAGEYELMVTDENDCEVTTSIILEGTSLIETSENVSLCEGDMFEWENFIVIADTTVCMTYSLEEGCDSIHCITLNFLQESTEEQFEQICEGETYDFNGSILNTTGIYYDTLSIANQNGCDSIIQLNLEIVVNPSFQINSFGNLCVDDEVTIQVIGEADYTYLWSTGEIAESIQVSSPSSYEVTTTNQEGCEAVEIISINENDISFDIQHLNADCNTENGQLLVGNVQGGLPPYSYSIDGLNYQLTNQFDDLPSGIYEIFIEDSEGCIHSQIVNLDQSSQIEVIGFDEEYEVNLGETVEIQIQTNVLNPTISWNPSRFLSCDTCQTVTIQAFENITYNLLVEDENGCISEVEINILVDQKEEVYIPNAFSPNDDGFNDLFTIYGGQAIERVKSFQIFDRWGALVFEENDQPVNSIGGWDGTFNNRDVLQGVYVYRIVTERIDGQERSLSGEVLLIR